MNRLAFLGVLSLVGACAAPADDDAPPAVTESALADPCSPNDPKKHDHAWRECWRKRPPGDGVKTPLPPVSYASAVDVASLVKLEYALLVHMRTTDNPAALYDDARAHVDAVGEAVRAKYTQFVIGDGRYASLLFSLQIRESQNVGWAPGAYVEAPKWSLGDLIYQDNGRSFEDYHAYDWFSNEAELDEHFWTINPDRERAIRLYNNSYRLPPTFLEYYLTEVNTRLAHVGNE